MHETFFGTSGKKKNYWTAKWIVANEPSKTKNLVY